MGWRSSAGAAPGPTEVLSDEQAAQLEASGRMTPTLAELVGRRPPASRYPGTMSSSERLGRAKRKESGT
eukprot:SAG31_NODE_2392_length_5797_cov_6.901369_4_plen_69_part_00